MRNASVLAMCSLLLAACSQTSDDKKDGDDPAPSQDDPVAVQSTTPAPVSPAGVEPTPGTGSAGSNGATAPPYPTDPVRSPSGEMVDSAALCHDGIQNGYETGVDCGGGCRGCDAGERCNTSYDCATGHDCNSASVCQINNELGLFEKCMDGVQNGDETGVDCGATCGPCPPEPSCTDQLENQDETSVDCGGSICSACAGGHSCNVDADCASRVCGDLGLCEASD